MVPMRISGATLILKAPKDWDTEKNGECTSLAVRQAGVFYESAWEPTPAELALLNAGGSIILGIWGGQPAVNLRVEPVPE